METCGMSVLGIQSDNFVFEVNSYERTGLLDLMCCVYRAEINRATSPCIEPRMASTANTKPKDMERC